MSLPSLPPDLWYRISTYLDPASLSSLSQVNRVLNQIATDDSHFHRHLRIPHTKHTHPAQEYRRLQALYHPPRNYVFFKFSSPIRMLAVVQDSLLLLSITNFAIIVFPSGMNFSLEYLFGNPGFPDKASELMDSFVVLPDNCIALMNCHISTRIAIVSLNTGEVVRHTLPGTGAVIEAKILKKNLIAAGKDAQWLMYHATEDKLVLFNWRSGTVDREIRISSGPLKYVMGECRPTNTMSVVGYLSEHTNGTRREIHAHVFDGADIRFTEDREKEVLMILRSYDEKTRILLTSQNDDYKYTESEFYARKEDEDGVKEWRGMLRLRKWPELKENGRVIQSRQDPCWLEFDVHALFGFGGSETLWMELKDDCTVAETSIYSALATSWIRRTPNGGLVLAAGGEGDDFKLVEMMNREDWSTECLMKRWKVDGLESFCIVADHFIVALSETYELYIHHIDRFCAGGSGVYGCPGFDEDKFLEMTKHLDVSKEGSGSEMSLTESETESETASESEGDSVLGEFW